jgi:hypothetical protein
MEVVDVRLRSRTASALALLGEASRTVDDLWKEAVDEARTDEAIDLSEASQGIHRAMIALGPHATQVPDTEIYWG